MAFRVGQNVVCVNDIPMRGYARADVEIHYGQIYTVRWVGPSPHPFNIGKPSVKLVEIVRPSDSSNCAWDDMPWDATRFRPIVERKTDISIFSKMLHEKVIEVEDA